VTVRKHVKKLLKRRRSASSPIQRASRGGQNTWVHLVGTDKPLVTALAVGLALAAMWMAYTNHESDQALIREFNDFAAKTYNREVAIDADLNIMNIDVKKRYGEIPMPPNVK
jgi:hypothetical protein